MVSVLLATYNGEKYIEKQLNSILNQTQLPDEVIVVDDVSDDSTISIVRDYSKKFQMSNVNLKIFINEKNKGYAKNFWDGIQKCNGDIVFLCDQDDVWFSNKIEEVVNVFNSNEKILCLNFAYELVDENEKKIKNIKSMKFKNNRSLRKIDVKNFIVSPRYPGMSLAFKKKMLDISELHIDKVNDHDWTLNLIASYNGGMYFFDKILTKYRQHLNNTVGIIDKKSNREIISIRIKNIEHLILNNTESIHYFKNNEIYASFINELNKVLQKRVFCIDKKSLISLTLNYICNKKYMTLRCYLGDFYTILKGK